MSATHNLVKESDLQTDYTNYLVNSLTEDDKGLERMVYISSCVCTCIPEHASGVVL